MDAGTKPTGTYLWRPAKLTECIHVRFRAPVFSKLFQYFFYTTTAD